MAIEDKYEILDNAFKTTPKDNPKDRIEVVVGDDKDSSKVQPQVKLMRWDNEVNASFRLLNFDNYTVNTEGEKIKLVNGTKEVHMYELPPSEELREGGYELEVILKEKPKTNVLEFSIETKDLRFALQPRMDAGRVAEEKARADGYQNISWFNKEFIDRYYNLNDRKDDYTETTSPDELRPENVVGSYAVYHKTKGGLNDINGMEYKVGKAFHIYRPKIIDADGNWTWGELFIDVDQGIQRITIPQDFLDNAVYPIRHASGETFGYTTDGGSEKAEGRNDAIGSKFTTTTGGGVTQGNCYVRVNNEGESYPTKFLIVLNSTLNLISNGVSNPTTIDSWPDQALEVFSFASNPTILATTDYILMLIQGTFGGTFYLAYDAGAAGQGNIDSTNSYSTPANLGSVTTNTNKYSIYATYTPSAADHEKGLSDSQSISEATAKTVTKPAIADTHTPAEALAKTVNLPALVDAHSLGESVANKSTLGVSDAITLTESKTIVNEFYRSLSDTLSISEALAKDVETPLADAHAPTEALAKTISLALTDEITFAESPTITNEFYRSLSDTISLADSEVEETVKALVDTLSIAESLANTTTLSLSDSIALAESLARTVEYHLGLSDEHFIADATGIDVAISLSDSMGAVTEALSLEPQPKLSDAITFAEAISKQPNPILSDVTGAFTETSIRKPVLYKTDNVIYDIFITGKEIVVNLTDSVTIAEEISASIYIYQKSLSDSISLSESITKVGVAKPLSESADTFDEIVKGVAKFATDSISIMPDMPDWRLGFDGSDDYIDCGSDSSLNLTSALTFELFIKPNVALEACYPPYGGNRGVAGKVEGINSSSNWSWQLRYGSADSCRLGIQLNTVGYGAQWATAKQDLTTGVLSHIAATFDGRYIKFYVDGVLTDINDLGGSTTIKSYLNKLLLASEGWSDSTGYFDGDMLEIRLWDKALDGDDIAIHAGSVRDTTSVNTADCTYATNCMAHYSMLEEGGTGTTLIDKTTNNNDGTFKGVGEPAWAPPEPTKDVGKSLTESVSISESVLVGGAQILSESLSISESLTKNIVLVFADTLAISEDLEKGKFLPLTESVPISESVGNSAGLALSDEISIAESSVRVNEFYRTSTDSQSITEAEAKTITKILSDSVDFSDAEIEKAVVHLEDSVTPVAEASVRSIVKNLTESLSIADSEIEAISLVFSDAISISEGVAPFVEFKRSLDDSVAFSEGLIWEIGLFKAESVGIAESVGNSTTLRLTDSVSITESETESVGIPGLADSISIAEASARAIVKNLSETLTIADSVLGIYNIDLSDSISLSESITTKDFAKELQAALVIAESLDIGKSVVLSDSLSISESLAKEVEFSRGFSDSVSIEDSGISVYAVPLSDSASISESIVLKPSKKLVESVRLREEFSTDFLLRYRLTQQTFMRTRADNRGRRTLIRSKYQQ